LVVVTEKALINIMFTCLGEVYLSIQESATLKSSLVLYYYKMLTTKLYYRS